MRVQNDVLTCYTDSMKNTVTIARSPLRVIDGVNDVAVNTFTGRHIDIIVFNRPLTDVEVAEFIADIRGDARITRVPEFANELYIENGTPQSWEPQS